MKPKIYRYFQVLSSGTIISNHTIYKCHKLLSNNYSATSQKSKIKCKTVVHPDIKRINKKNLDTILGINIGFNGLGWTLLQHDSTILDWDVHIWNNKMSKIPIYDAIRMASLFVDTLPPASIYVLETMNTFSKSKQIVFPQYFFIAIATVIGEMEKKRLENILFILEADATARYFKLLIKKEKVSAKYAITNLIKDFNECEEQFNYIHLNDTVKSKYTSKNEIEKELIGWSLLKALTLLHLIPTSDLK